MFIHAFFLTNKATLHQDNIQGYQHINWNKLDVYYITLFTVKCSMLFDSLGVLINIISQYG